MKQQPAPNYGRLRESNCVILVSLFACFPSSFPHQADFSTPVLHPPRQPFPPSRVIFPSPVFLRLSPAASHPPRSDQSQNHHESCSDNKVHSLTLFGFIHPSTTDSFKCNKQTNTGRIIWISFPSVPSNNRMLKSSWLSSALRFSWRFRTSSYFWTTSLHFSSERTGPRAAPTPPTSESEGGVIVTEGKLRLRITVVFKNQSDYSLFWLHPRENKNNIFTIFTRPCLTLITTVLKTSETEFKY